MRSLLPALLLASSALALDSIEVKFAEKNVPLTADPSTSFWKAAKPVTATKNNLGLETIGKPTEIRARWTQDSLYVLFICPYTDLYLLPNPNAVEETNKLWEHDVAEIFVGADFEKIHQYREYQVSPQGEWVDLNIDTKQPLPEGGWKWNSGMKVKARIDEQAKIWYGEFQIPLASITDKPVAAGTKMRGDFFRFEGGPPKRKSASWIPTGRPSNHTPEAFGTLDFVK
jgi:hypothetical protein